MATLSFTINPEAVGRLQEALICLGKFSETVSIEATRDQFVLTALNSTKSAYASFEFAANRFFERYSYNPPRTNGIAREKFICKIYNKALLAVFKTRNGDPSREKDTGIEKCEVTVEDETGGVKSRFVVRLMCRHGVLKVYRLTFEPTASIHAIFDASINKNRWEISSRTLREFVEHFGPGTEYLDIFSEDGRVSFISFTEKVVSGSQVLRQPLHTSIAIDTLEFSHFSVEEGLHLVISVKDFKAIITHAGSISTTVVACYSYPSRPLQLKYSDDGITSEFILMTMGDFKGRSITPSIGSGRATSKRPVTRQALEASSNRKITSHSMAPPRASTAVRSRTVRPSPPPPQPSIEANAMFFTESDDDGRWDPVGSEEEREEAIGWNATAENDANAISFNRTLHNHAPSTQGLDKGARDESGSAQQVSPTQRISQIRGLFD